ncbi:MAG: Na(+)-translocating NADH-quinone reductase subunit A [Bacteroidota bacterium]
MAKVVKIKKGLDIKLKGKADKILEKPDRAGLFALRPTDFKGLTPKLAVKEGQEVKVGSPLFFDKYNPDILFTSPVAGKVSAIVRGERRKILEVVVEAGKKDEYESFVKADPQSLDAKDIKENLLKSGLWPSIRQRPYNVIANPEDTPKFIYISTFDTAPLSPDMDYIFQDSEKSFQDGINALARLTKGKVRLGLNADFPPAKAFTEAKNVEQFQFSGPHPTGNPGIQIHHVDPINKGEVVWVVGPQDVVAIGRLFENGRYDASKTVALTGSEVLKPRYYKVTNGESIVNLVKDNVTSEKLRYISGNVLTGTRINADGYVGYYDSQITVIPEGDYYEFMGWAAPGVNKYSNNRSFLSWWASKDAYTLDTNMHGGKRAYVVTGEYESVLPMDIYPVQLIKSILVEDIDLMEKLGIYEVVEEDMALCEFVCTSKIEVQSILSRGLDMMKKEMS